MSLTSPSHLLLCSIYGKKTRKHQKSESERRVCFDIYTKISFLLSVLGIDVTVGYRVDGIMPSEEDPVLREINNIQTIKGYWFVYFVGLLFVTTSSLGPTYSLGKTSQPPPPLSFSLGTPNIARFPSIGKIWPCKCP